MKKILVIAEKPDQAKRYSQAFKNREEHFEAGYIKVDDSSVMEGQIKITYAVGHLLELKEPEEYDDTLKHTTLDALPIIPSEFEYKPIADKKKQLEKIKQLTKKADVIVVAGDPEREGELIQRLILNYCGITPKNKVIKRLFTNSLEVSAVKNAFKNLEDDNSSRWNNKYQEAKARQHSDWLVGMNLSRLYSILLKQLGLTNTTVSIGRVQTPTLKLVYDRCNEISNFKTVPYREVVAKTKISNFSFVATLNPPQKFFKADDLKIFLAEKNLSLGQNMGKVVSVVAQIKKKESPKLLNLSGLQELANSKFHYTAQTTMAAEQYLYDKGYASYPRSDSNFITVNEFSYLKDNWENYADFLNVKIANPNLTARTRYVNPKKVSEHTAIIPTAKKMTRSLFNDLSVEQQNIYLLILQRTLGMFAEDFVFEETTILFDVGKAQFKITGQIVKNPGWKKIIKSSDKDILLPDLHKDDKFDVNLELQNKKTTPPSFFSEGTLIKAMNDAGKIADNNNKAILKEVGGIGTEATRAGIIEKLKLKNYIVLENNKLKITDTGTVIAQAVEPQKLLSKPDLTARWELALKEIGEGKRNYSNFLDLIKKFIDQVIHEAPLQVKENSDLLSSIATSKKNTNVNEKQKKLGKCPLCGGDVVDKGKIYGCSNYQNNNCQFLIYKKLAAKNLSVTTIKQLLTNGKSKTKIKGFKKADGTTFDSYLKLEVKDNKGKISFDFRSKQ